MSVRTGAAESRCLHCGHLCNSERADEVTTRVLPGRWARGYLPSLTRSHDARWPPCCSAKLTDSMPICFRTPCPPASQGMFSPRPASLPLGKMQVQAGVLPHSSTRCQVPSQVLHACRRLNPAACQPQVSPASKAAVLCSVPVPGIRFAHNLGVRISLRACFALWGPSGTKPCQSSVASFLKTKKPGRRHPLSVDRTSLSCPH